MHTEVPSSSLAEQRYRQLTARSVLLPGLSFNFSGISPYDQNFEGRCATKVRDALRWGNPARIAQEVNRATTQESARILQEAENNRSLSVDVLIIGDGPTGVSIASDIRRAYPGLNMLFMTNRPIRGGQFSDKGSFNLNSPSYGPKLSFPGEMYTPNYLSPSMMAQIEDTAQGKYPTQEETAATLALNGFLTAEAVVGVNARHITKGKHGGQVIQRVDARHGHKKFTIESKVILLAPGLGEPTYGGLEKKWRFRMLLGRNRDKIRNSQGIRMDIETKSPAEIMKMLDKGLVFVGAQDSTNIAIEGLVARLQQMGYSNDQINKKFHIDIYGAKYTDGQSFKTVTNLNRYDGLAEFVGANKFIRPHTEKVVGIGKNRRRGSLAPFTLRTSKKGSSTFDTIAFMTGYKNTAKKLVRGLGKVIDIYGDVGVSADERNIKIGQQVKGTNVFVAGPGSGTEDNRGRFGASIRLFAPRNNTLGEQIINQLPSMLQ